MVEDTAEKFDIGTVQRNEGKKKRCDFLEKLALLSLPDDSRKERERVKKKVCCQPFKGPYV